MITGDCTEAKTKTCLSLNLKRLTGKKKDLQKKCEEIDNNNNNNN